MFFQSFKFRLQTRILHRSIFLIKRFVALSANQFSISVFVFPCTLSAQTDSASGTSRNGIFIWMIITLHTIILIINSLFINAQKKGMDICAYLLFRYRQTPMLKISTNNPRPTDADLSTLILL